MSLYSSFLLITNVYFRCLSKPCAIIAKASFGFSIEIGCSFQEVLKLDLIKPVDIQFMLSYFSKNKYLPVIDMTNRKVYLILSEDADDEIILKGYFHCCFYSLVKFNVMNTKSVNIFLCNY